MSTVYLPHVSVWGNFSSSSSQQQLTYRATKINGETDNSLGREGDREIDREAA